MFFIREKSKSVRFLFSIANTGEDISKHDLIKNSDIVHLHWINQGFLSLKSLKKIFKLNKPVVWTLHDMWAFTGGCHHSGSCEKYKTSCRNCPFLRFPWRNDLSHRLWKHKIKINKKADLTIVTCSEWLKKSAIESSILAGKKIISIPNPINTNIFVPTDKLSARKKFDLQENKKYLMFGAVNVNNYFKGFTYFKEALKLLVEQEPDMKNKIELVILGRSTPEVLKELPFKCTIIKKIDDEDTMCQLYNAVDVYVTPSLQENLPNTIMESFACGTPVVAFNIGGIPEMVDHKQNGYLAEYLSSNDLANGIRWTLFEANTEMLSKNARNKVLENYSEEIVANKYIGLYHELLK